MTRIVGKNVPVRIHLHQVLPINHTAYQPVACDLGAAMTRTPDAGHTYSYQSSDKTLSNLPWIRLINHITRAVHTSCILLLSQLIAAIVKELNDKSAWNNLLNFASAVLAKPQRRGANKNLSNIINKRVIVWNKDYAPLSPPVYQGRRQQKGNNENNRLASFIASELEMGNFKTAVEILCSDEKLAPTTAEILKAHQDKHLPALADIRTARDPKGNLHFAPLQISPEDVKKVLRSFSLRSSGVQEA